MRILAALLTITLAMAHAGNLAAQDPKTNPQNPPGQPAGMNAMDHDRHFATCLLVGNNNEIALAEIAVQRASDSEVKQFAQKMIDDHKKIGQDLQRFAPGVVASAGHDRSGAPTTRDNKGEERLAGERDRRTATGETGRSFDPDMLIKELGDQCLESSRKALEGKSGKEFDRCFMGMAIGAHMAVNDEITVFDRHAGPELKKVLEDGQKVVKAHLDHAINIEKRLWEQAEKGDKGEKKNG
jgi:putative membrane protein